METFAIMTDIKTYTITIFADNKPGVLYRISDLFLRRKVNIESLTVSETPEKGLSRFTIVIKELPITVERIVKQLYRIIEIGKVFESKNNELLYKEIALIKVSTKNFQQRQAVQGLIDLSQAKIIHVETDSLTIEKTGTEEEIDELIALVRRFGIKEFVRSGRIALIKGENSHE